MEATVAGQPTMDEFVVGGFRWRTKPEYRDVLFGPAGLRLGEWLASGRAAIVKQGPHRVVYRVALPGLCFYLKHNRVPDRRTWIRKLFRPVKARREYLQSIEVARRGVATVEPLAVGESAGFWSSGESFLITRALEGAIQLNEFINTLLPSFPPAQQTRLRICLAHALGAFIARLHDAGIQHNDLHCGNILIRIDGDVPLLYLIDLQNIRIGEPLSWAQSRANLIMLNRWLVLRVGRPDRMRFLKAYTAHRRCLPGESPAAPARLTFKARARDLEKATRRSNERFWRRREKRCLEVNRHFRQFSKGSIFGYAVTDFDAGFLVQLLEDPDAPFRQAGAKILKNARSAAVVELTAPVRGRPQALIYKRFGVRELTEPVAGLVRKSAALRSWLYGHSLLERGLATARPLAVFHRFRCGMCQEGYLLMEKVQAVGDLHAAAAALDSLSARERARILRRRIDQLAGLIRELHRRHLSHRDLKAANILLMDDCRSERVASEAVVGRPHNIGIDSPFCFIDLVGVSRRRRLRRKVRVKNLTRLHASFHNDPRITRTDKLRFLRAYLQWGLLGKQGWKRWWRAIDAATRRKVAKNLRMGRPLS